MPEAATDLREACVAAAHAVIAQHGVENLSLRDVARRLGVSHQAPYKHYPSRDHLLAEVIRRCFQRFAAHLSAGLHGLDAQAEMDSLGGAYMAYAMANPLEYRLMFGTPWPDTAQHPDLLRDARHSFDVLRGAIARMRGHAGAPKAEHDLDAMYVWASMHGLATILQSNVMDKLSLRPGVLKQTVPHAMMLVSAALAASPGLRAPPTRLPARPARQRRRI
ncbi:MAG: TetR/AcrR family transcriptional regulator [Ramlibacter sp.]